MSGIVLTKPAVMRPVRRDSRFKCGELLGHLLRTRRQRWPGFEEVQKGMWTSTWTCDMMLSRVLTNVGVCCRPMHAVRRTTTAHSTRCPRAPTPTMMRCVISRGHATFRTKKAMRGGSELGGRRPQSWSSLEGSDRGQLEENDGIVPMLWCRVKAMDEWSMMARLPYTTLS